MNEAAKIQLSAREMELVNNTEWIFTKQLIIEKVYSLLGHLHEDYKELVNEEQECLPPEMLKPGGKISKGENYNGLPYVILDYPASFSREKILAVRTLFWWGNFFSIALHISGESFKNTGFSDKAIAFLEEKNFSICVNENEWEHHFDASNFVKINSLEKGEMKNLQEKTFLKIAKKTELTEWNSAAKFLEDAFKEIIEFVKLSYQDGEKDL